MRRRWSAGGRRRVIRSLVALAWFAPVFATAAQAQVSPGPLATAHAALEGNLGCVKCHGKGEGEMDRKCRACHEEVALLVKRGRGFHGREGAEACARCHPDHGGRDFALVAWPDKSPEKFDHARTGWLLKGKHAVVECSKCHARANVAEDVFSLLKTKRGVVWMGIDSNCRTCHQDVHARALGDDCERCHSEQGWRHVPGFDHSRTAFPLTGLHARVECAKCHEAAHLNVAKDTAGRPIPLYKPLAHDECGACHADPHRGSFGVRCASCHVTTGFRVIERERFDHDMTRYPLRGQHASVACDVCHNEKTGWGRKPAFAMCSACHRDPHAGQATVAGSVADCSACHTVGGFKPSTFSAGDHEKTPFRLVGAHARVPCMDCHGPGRTGGPVKAAAGARGADVRFHPAHQRCVDCHSDPHGGRFAPGATRGRNDDCLTCHTMEAFRPSTFDVAAHETATFRLQGAHRAVPCVACHAELQVRVAAEDAVLLMKNDASSCRDCHATPHGTQFDGRKNGGACDMCHDMARFKPASGFDHGRVKSFPLDGKHRNVACERCHPTVTTSDGKRMIHYRPISVRCESCHASGDADSERN